MDKFLQLAIKENRLGEVVKECFGCSYFLWVNPEKITVLDNEVPLDDPIKFTFSATLGHNYFGEEYIKLLHKMLSDFIESKELTNETDELLESAIKDGSFPEVLQKTLKNANSSNIIWIDENLINIQGELYRLESPMHFHKLVCGLLKVYGNEYADYLHQYIDSHF